MRPIRTEHVVDRQRLTEFGCINTTHHRLGGGLTRNAS
jgi:hypothetical protein